MNNNNLRIARQLVRLARTLVADDEKELAKQVEKEVSVNDVIRNQEKSLEKISDIVQDPELDNLINAIGRKA